MIKKAALVLGVALGIMSTAAEARGYWEYKTVCDYETVYKDVDFTSCSYGGWESQKYFRSSSILNGHVSCSSGINSSQWVDKETCNWEYQGVYPNQKYVRVCKMTPTFTSVWLNLESQSHQTRQDAVRQKVPGSCREERVWIPLCSNCQIP
ncbi:hypothetical protein [Pseudoalteromonas sp. MMG012]|uniref:hypothetical protein n=1 Tax=Pseudoalteromonas sp. MMG012 TaxID=2822686 RepID=UPI001B39F86C|nr:hypothetical protein [Pseudoalteromonas sp. MMG012]MBQ4849600.1 hypothetical protein [Pseudoalteromonas sp. MMG012]